MFPDGSYVLSNARLHASLTPGLVAAFDADGFALADIAVANGVISSIAAH
ncbi:MAG: cytosine deaminase, partial [Mesorhizobium sp.]